MDMNKILGFLDALVAKPVCGVSGKSVLVALFILCALPVGLNMAFLVPLGQVPDEPAHAARAAGLLRGQILVIRKQADRVAHSGVKIDAALAGAAFGTTTPVGTRPHIVTEADDQRDKAGGWSGAALFADIPNTAMYFPAFYAPAAIGLKIGKLFQLLPRECLFTARIFMLSAFLILGGASLWLTKAGEAWLFAILTLPMTLFLAGSLSADGLLIAAACLSAALLTRKSSAANGNGVGAAFLLGLIGAAKIPYAAILGLILIPLRETPRNKLVIAGAAGILVLAWGLLAQIYSSVPFEKPPYHPGPLWGGDPDSLFHQTDPGANLHILLSDPGLLFRLPYDYFSLNGWHALDEGIGILGLLELQFSDDYYSAWKAILLFSLIGQIFVSRPGPAECSSRGWLDIALVLLLILLVAWIIPIALYLNWTDVGAPHVDGVQGRYFILLLPFLLLCVPRLPVLARIPRLVLAAPVLLLGIFDLAFLPRQIVQLFYLH